MITPESTTNIRSKEDLAVFLDEILKDYSESATSWENQDIPSFIEAFQAWLRAGDGYYKNMNIDVSEVTPWRFVADALAAARIYE